MMDPYAWRPLQRLLAEPPDPALSLVVVAAHPDDEVVGASSLLARARDARVVHVTDGSPRDLGDARRAGCTAREEYAALRRLEARSALRCAGLTPQQVHALSVPGERAVYAIETVARKLALVFARARPALVVTHAYEGAHPDHDATCLAVHLARALVAGRCEPPALFEMTSFHMGPDGSRSGAFLGDAPAHTRVLTPRERRLKRRMLACHASQASALAAFRVDVERFRPAPAYDFRAPPHAGTLYYQTQRYRTDPARFLTIAWRAVVACGAGDLSCV